MSDSKGVTIKYVKGISKKNNREWFGCAISFPTINGGYREKIVFFNDLEIQLLGLQTSDFIEKK